MNIQDNDKVSVIIPTFNRFDFLLNAIQSVKTQTYKNIEIIVINDGSNDQRYYNYRFEGCIVINLDQNSKQKFGFVCSSYVRNMGIKISSGEYIAFLDDDDIWFPNKLELQIQKMKELKCKMSCTDGLIGEGIFDKDKKYKIYNKEWCFETICEIFKHKGRFHLLKNENGEIGFPKIWNKEFLLGHNCVITSSVIINSDILKFENGFKIMSNGIEDFDCWIRILNQTQCIYIDEPCIYYDSKHGNGQEYK